MIHFLTLPLKSVCGTLVTLHFLDSRPLSEAFGALLNQRSKALTSLVSWKLDLPHIANGRYGSGSSSRQYLPKEIQQANQKALMAIIDTVHISRQIFQIPSDKKLSLISSVLHLINDDTSSQQASRPELSPDLLPSTNAILTNSSSSAHFSLLPASLQEYRPYIDLTSSSLMYSQTQFNQVLQDWFHKSAKSWRDASSNWFTNLSNVSEIWSLRTSIQALVKESPLEAGEKAALSGILDGLCHSRICAVWLTLLSSARDSFKSDLSTYLSQINERVSCECLLFSISVHILNRSIVPGNPFKAPSPPLSAQSMKSSESGPFQQYQASLKRQLLGRSAQLDAALITLEQCARVIQSDLATLLLDRTEEGM